VVLPYSDEAARANLADALRANVPGFDGSLTGISRILVTPTDDGDTGGLALGAIVGIAAGAAVALMILNYAGYRYKFSQSSPPDSQLVPPAADTDAVISYTVPNQEVETLQVVDAMPFTETADLPQQHGALVLLISRIKRRLSCKVPRRRRFRQYRPNYVMVMVPTTKIKYAVLLLLLEAQP